MNRLNVTIILCLFFQLSFGQVPRDTSYNFSSAFQKVKKSYPNATIPAKLDGSDVKIETNFVYKELGERQLLADLFSPKKANGVGIVLVHGGGWISGDKSMMALMAERLASTGYLVMVPEYRLSPEAKFPAAVIDLKNAVKWLRAHATEFEIDESQISIIGCSAGGQLAALVGTTNDLVEFEDSTTDNSSLIQAIIDIDGVLKFKHPDSQEGVVAGKWLGGSYEEVPEIWEAASALNHVSKDSPPTLFIASKYPRFLAGHQEYMDRLKGYGIYTNKYQMEDAPHSFWLFNPWFDTTLDYIITFLEDTFKTTSY